MGENFNPRNILPNECMCERNVTVFGNVSAEFDPSLRILQVPGSSYYACGEENLGRTTRQKKKGQKGGTRKRKVVIRVWLRLKDQDTSKL